MHIYTKIGRFALKQVLPIFNSCIKKYLCYLILKDHTFCLFYYKISYFSKKANEIIQPSICYSIEMNNFCILASMIQSILVSIWIHLNSFYCKFLFQSVLLICQTYIQINMQTVVTIHKQFLHSASSLTAAFALFEVGKTLFIHSLVTTSVEKHDPKILLFCARNFS